MARRFGDRFGGHSRIPDTSSADKGITGPNRPLHVSSEDLQRPWHVGLVIGLAGAVVSQIRRALAESAPNRIARLVFPAKKGKAAARLGSRG